MNKKLIFRISVILGLLFLAIFSVYLLHREDRQGILTVAFLNIGQGDSIFIESPTGNQMLIDGGPGKSVLRELGSVMPFYDRSIDVLLATHADQDHVGGLPDVLQNYKVNYFFETGNPGPSSSYEELEKITDQESKEGKLEKVLARRGMVIDLGGGAELQILFPDRDPVGMDTNTSSIVAKLTYGNESFMLTGDSPRSIEDYLVKVDGANLKSTVLKPGHHGSKTSSEDAYIAEVAPEYAVISAGLNNRYGHPHQETLDTLNKYHIKILRTDQDGRIVFKTDGENLMLK